MSLYWQNLFWPQITPKSFANWKLFVLSVFLWNKRQKQVGMKYYEPGPSPPPITTKNQLLIIAILAKLANKPLFFANIESPAGYLWQFTSVAIYVVSVITFWRQGRYICFRPELSLIIVKGFVELLIYPRRTKTGELCCWFFFKEPSLSFIHGGGRHKLIHEVVKRIEQNRVRKNGAKCNNG